MSQLIKRGNDSEINLDLRRNRWLFVWLLSFPCCWRREGTRKPSYFFRGHFVFFGGQGWRQVSDATKFPTRSNGSKLIRMGRKLRIFVTSYGFVVISTTLVGDIGRRKEWLSYSIYLNKSIGICCCCWWCVVSELMSDRQVVVMSLRHVHATDMNLVVPRHPPRSTT